MQNISDGKAEKNRKRNKSDSSDRRSRLGGIRNSSPIDGTKSLGIAPTNSTKEDNLGAAISFDGETDAGKILERLEMLEDAFREYVGGHQNRLEARLQESKKFETRFTQEVQVIKQEIYNMASQSKEAE